MKEDTQKISVAKCYEFQIIIIYVCGSLDHPYQFSIPKSEVYDKQHFKNFIHQVASLEPLYL